MSGADTLVLLPGLLSDGVVWQGAVAASGTTLPVAVADLTAHDTLAGMAAAVLAAHPGRLAVAGHSMGGRVALEMMRQAAGRIAGLALFDTGIHPPRDGEAAPRAALAALARDQGMAALAARWLPPMVHPDRHGDADLMGRLTAMVERMDPAIHARQLQALLTRPDAGPLLPGIACPVLLGVGRQDAWSPLAQHQDMAARLPDAHLVVIEDAGHFAPMERPEATGAALAGWLVRL